MEGYVHRVFGLEHGLPKGLISHVLRDRHGYLWLATQDGLARFDGLSTEVFDSDRFPALGSNRIRQLLETRDGTLWIWTQQRHLSRYRDGIFTACEAPGEDRARCDLEVGHGRFGRPIEVPDDTLWVGSFSGVYRWQDEMLVREPTITETEVTRIIYPDSRGRLWIGTRKNLWTGHAGSFEKVDIGPETGVSAVVETPEGEIWVLTDRGVGRVRDGRFRVEEEEGYLVLDARGTLWSGRSDGLWRYQGERWLRIADPVTGIFTGLRTTPNPGPDGAAWMSWGSTMWRDGVPVFRLPQGTRFTRPILDSQGILWAPTSGSGVVHAFLPQRVETFAAGLDPAGVGSVYEDHDGTLWVTRDADLATLAPGATRFEVHAGPRRPITEFPIHVEPIATLRDRSGTMWVGTQRGLYSREGDGYRGPHGPEPMRWQMPALLEDTEGALWAGTSNGLFRRDPDDGSWSRFTSEAVQERSIRVILETSPGTFWLGTDGAGVVRFRNGVFTRIDQGRGLSSNLVQSLWQAPSGHLWIGTENRGLCRLDPETVEDPEGPEIVSISRRQGLWYNAIHQIVDDGLGHLWFSSNQGIFRVVRQDLEAVADGKKTRVESVVFTEMDGMTDREASGRVHQTGLRDRHGKLWFPTTAGLVKVDPQRLELSVQPPRVHLQSLQTDDEQRPLTGDRLELSPDQRTFAITYTAPTFRAPERLRFRYRLVPYDREWVAAGSRREARYTKVPPGRYTFEVAVNEDGVWSPSPTTLTLAVEARFYETRWFLGLCLAAVVSALLGAVRLREMRSRARQLELEKQVRDRTATIAEQAEQLLELDRLKSEFFANISHELRTPLTLMLGPLRDALAGSFGPLNERLKPQIDLAARQAQSQLGLVEQLLDVAKLDAGQLRLRKSRGDLAALLRRRVEAFLFLAEKKEIELSLEVPESTVEAAFDPVELSKVIDNLLSNAVKFTPRGGRVRVVLEIPDGDWVQLTVSDTGPGIAPDERQSIFERFHRADISGQKPGTGLGLALARQLVEMHGGRLELEAPAEPGDGACFIVSLPRGTETDPLESEEVDASVDSVSATAISQLAADSASSLVTEAPSNTDSSSDVDLPVALVVDDNADIRTYIRRHLEPTYVVNEAADGREALEDAHRQPPDVVVSDVMMPEVDGLELFRKLRLIPELELVPVILVTAKASSASRLEGLHEGVDDYLVKPFEGRELRARIDNLLASRRRLLEKFEVPAPRGLALPEVDVTPADQSLLERLQSVLEARLGDPELNVGELARELSCSRSYLTNKVRELVGEPPGAVIRSCRLERASQLLQADAGSVGDIAYSVGFRSVAHFSNAFYRHFGKRPSSFAARHRSR